MYPPITPFHSSYLQVSDIHQLYYEECGNPEGLSVIFLHGGPGGGCNASYRRYFDPDKYHIVLFDQRGCGRSTPFAELRQNTTWDLVQDIEKLRTHLKLKKWSVFGGSWGSTLALAYAQTHPEQVSALFLRGIFLLREKEIKWFYQEGCSLLFPDAWANYIALIPEDERDDLVSAYAKRLSSDDPAIRAEAAKAWSTWEGSTSKLIPDTAMINSYGNDKFADAFARIECHYFTHKGFLDDENQLLDNVGNIRHIPAIIVQGRYDVVCPMQSSWELHQAWPEAAYSVIADAGHSLSEKGITKELIRATDVFAATGAISEN